MAAIGRWTQAFGFTSKPDGFAWNFTARPLAPAFRCVMVPGKPVRLSDNWSRAGRPGEGITLALPRSDDQTQTSGALHGLPAVLAPEFAIAVGEVELYGRFGKAERMGDEFVGAAFAQSLQNTDFLSGQAGGATGRGQTQRGVTQAIVRQNIGIPIVGARVGPG